MLQLLYFYLVFIKVCGKSAERDNNYVDTSYQGTKKKKNKENLLTFKI